MAEHKLQIKNAIIEIIEGHPKDNQIYLNVRHNNGEEYQLVLSNRHAKALAMLIINDDN